MNERKAGTKLACGCHMPEGITTDPCKKCYWCLEKEAKALTARIEELKSENSDLEQKNFTLKAKWKGAEEELRKILAVCQLRDAEIEEIKNTITELQIQHSKGYYTTLHETDRKRLKAELHSEKERTAALVDLLKIFDAELDAGNGWRIGEGVTQIWRERIKEALRQHDQGDK